MKDEIPWLKSNVASNGQGEQKWDTEITVFPSQILSFLILFETNPGNKHDFKMSFLTLSESHRQPLLW